MNVRKSNNNKIIIFLCSAIDLRNFFQKSLVPYTILGSVRFQRQHTESSPQFMLIDKNERFSKTKVDIITNSDFLFLK